MEEQNWENFMWSLTRCTDHERGMGIPRTSLAQACVAIEYLDHRTFVFGL